MTSKCDAVVIGAGVIGSSVAYELARKGLSVIVVDKAAAPGLGSTSSSSAVIRFNYSTYDAVALSWEAFQCWKNWRTHLSAPADEVLAEVRNIGVLMVKVPVVSIPLTQELFTEVGIEHEVVGASECKRLFLALILECIGHQRKSMMTNSGKMLQIQLKLCTPQKVDTLTIHYLPQLI
jgi:sarcosine oxidase, subunit beta